MLIIPDDSSFEHAVKAVVAKNYPQMTTHGLINVTISSTNATTNILSDRESGDANSPELMIWGVSMWGGNKVLLP